MKIGDKVMFSKRFCRSVGLFASNDPLVFRNRGGKILSIAHEVATILDWDDRTRKVRLSNLVLTTSLEP